MQSQPDVQDGGRVLLEKAVREPPRIEDLVADTQSVQLCSVGHGFCYDALTPVQAAIGISASEPLRSPELWAQLEQKRRGRKVMGLLVHLALSAIDDLQRLNKLALDDPMPPCMGEQHVDPQLPLYDFGYRARPNMLPQRRHTWSFC